MYACNSYLIKYGSLRYLTIDGHLSTQFCKTKLSLMLSVLSCQMVGPTTSFSAHPAQPMAILDGGISVKYFPRIESLILLLILVFHFIKSGTLCNKLCTKQKYHHCQLRMLHVKHTVLLK